MKDGKNNSRRCQDWMPAERDGLNPDKIQITDQGGKNQKQKSDNPRVHNHRLAENQRIGDFSNHILIIQQKSLIYSSLLSSPFFHSVTLPKEISMLSARRRL